MIIVSTIIVSEHRIVSTDICTTNRERIKDWRSHKGNCKFF